MSGLLSRGRSGGGRAGGSGCSGGSSKSSFLVRTPCMEGWALLQLGQVNRGMSVKRTFTLFIKDQHFEIHDDELIK